MAVPVLVVIYPALIVLTVLNILKKTHNIGSIKVPVYVATALCALWQHSGAVVQFWIKLR